MVLFLPYHSLKIFMALILTQIMLINLGYQQTWLDLQDPVAIDVCDHTDSEKECDKKETGEKDDLISHVTKTPIINFIHKSKARVATTSGYVSDPPEIASPPPEYSA